ncbi:MAG: ABC transporter ATP-binding protein [Desulfosarcinaceae bacterium]|nr:ABC transporter ATP-binding protein [Desulfosarcinaceae bacterium]
MKPLLEVADLTLHFGGVKALTDVSFAVREKEFLCLIGPNGAGKTTLLKSILGIVQPQQAEIRLAGRSITHLPTHRRIRLGLALTHQIVRPFTCMTVRDNVALAAGHQRLQRVLGALVHLDRRSERAKAAAFLERVGIGDYMDHPVAGLPLGVLKRLEVARALALSPRLLLLDEPLAGLNHVEAGRLADTVAEINQGGMTVVMIEHNLSEVLRVAQRLVVLDNGAKIAEGDPRQVLLMPTVQAAYLGEETDIAAD